MKPTRSLWTLIALILLVQASIAQTIVRGPYLQRATETSVVVRWRTDQPTASAVRYGASVNALTLIAQDATLVTEHIVTVGGLSAGERVYYTVGTPAGALQSPSAERYLRSLPTAGRATPTRVWVIGDSGTADDEARAVRDAYAAFTGPRATDLWLMLGDNAYPNGTDAEYQTAVFQNAYEAMLQKSVLWPTPGNHDALSCNSNTATGTYFDIFTLPAAGESGGQASGTESFYSFDYGDIHFVSLNSTVTDPQVAASMIAWLGADLQSTSARWIVAYWHHPPHSRGSHDSDTDPVQTAMRQAICPILEQNGVDLVLAGHSHSYERSMLVDGFYQTAAAFSPALHAKDTGDGRMTGGGAYRKPTAQKTPHEGTVYLVCGSSGELETGSLDHPMMATSQFTRGSLVLDFEEDELDIRFITDNGVVSDAMTLVKGRSTPVGRHTEFFPLLSTWRYDDLGVDRSASGFAAPAFDDSAWPSGPGPFGFGHPYLATVLSAAPVTTYLRKTFTLNADPADVRSLTAAAFYGDGFVVSLNGVEIARKNLPAGPLGFTLPAIAPHQTVPLETIDLSAAIGLLTQGTNTLAVELHQATPLGADLEFDMTLYADVFSPILGPAADGVVGDDVQSHEEPLTINGSTGGASRSVELALLEPITIEMAAPSTSPLAADFAIFGRFGTPTPAESIGFGTVGTFAFLPSVFDAANPAYFFLASSYGPDPTVIVPAGPAPFSLAAPGLPFAFDLTIQGVINEVPGIVRVTNGVRMTIH